MPTELVRGEVAGTEGDNPADRFAEALEVARDNLAQLEDFGSQEVEISFHAIMTVRNPADIDGYIVIISSLP